MEERLAQLRHMLTSNLIALIAQENVLLTWAFGEGWEEIFEAAAPEGETPEDFDRRISLVIKPLIAIAAEIDHRIPVPT